MLKSLSRPLPETLVLMAIGLVDMISTILLINLGVCEELNPLMAPLIRIHWLLFAFVKASTLALAFFVCEWHRRKDEAFVKRWARIGTAAYLLLWIVWFNAGWKF